MKDLNSALGQLRPILSLVGAALIIVGLLKFFGVQIPFGKGALELAVAGFLIKHV